PCLLQSLQQLVFLHDSACASFLVMMGGVWSFHWSLLNGSPSEPARFQIRFMRLLSFGAMCIFYARDSLAATKASSRATGNRSGILLSDSCPQIAAVGLGEAHHQRRREDILSQQIASFLYKGREA